MLSGISIICFAGCYVVTLVLETSRLFFRSGIRGAMMLACAGAGLFAHTVYLANRAAESTGSPLSSKQEWCLLAAWLLVAIYLYLIYYHRDRSFGVFILPLALALIGVGKIVTDSEPFAREPASRVWGAIHGVSLLLGTVAVLIGFVAGLMYLGQDYRLKRKLPPLRGLRLPSLEWLRRANGRTIALSLLFLGVGIVSGVILNVLENDSRNDRLPWSDPFVLSTFLMFVWMLLTTVIGHFYKPARVGHKVAYLTVVSFIFLVIALGIGLSVVTDHAGTSGSEEQSSRPTHAYRVLCYGRVSRPDHGSPKVERSGDRPTTSVAPLKTSPRFLPEEGGAE